MSEFEFPKSEYKFKMKKTLNMDLFKKSNHSYVTVILECVNKDGSTEFYEFAERQCFGFMRGIANLFTHTKPVALYTGIRRSNDKYTFMNDWHEWIFDPKVSPWRMIIPKDGLEYTLQNKATDKPYLKIPLDSKTPAQVLVSFLIASRLGTDQPTAAKLWVDLQEKGWDPYLALYASIYLGRDEKNQIVDHFYSGYWAFSTKVLNKLDWIKKGTPNYDKSNTFPKAYGTLQNIWYEGNPNYNRDGFYYIVAQAKKYEGAFPKYFATLNGTDYLPMTKMPSFDELLKAKDLLIEKVAA